MKSFENEIKITYTFPSKILSYFKCFEANNIIKDTQKEEAEFDLSNLVTYYTRLSFNFLLLIIIVLCSLIGFFSGGKEFSEFDYFGIFKDITIVGFSSIILIYNFTNKSFQVIKFLFNLFTLFVDLYIFVLSFENKNVENDICYFLRILYLYFLIMIILIIFRFDMKKKEVLLFLVYKIIFFFILIIFTKTENNYNMFIFEYVYLSILSIVIYLFSQLRKNFQIKTAEFYFDEKFQNKYYQNLFQEINKAILKINFSLKKISFNKKFLNLMHCLGVSEIDIINNLISYNHSKINNNSNIQNINSDNNYNLLGLNISNKEKSEKSNYLKNKNPLNFNNNSNLINYKQEKTQNSQIFISKTKTILDENNNLTVRIEKNININNFNGTNLLGTTVLNNISSENNLIKYDPFQKILKNNFSNTLIGDSKSINYINSVHKSKTVRILENTKSLNFSEKISLKFTNTIIKAKNKSLFINSFDQESESKRQKFLIEENAFIFKFNFLINKVFNGLFEEKESFQEENYSESFSEKKNKSSTLGENIKDIFHMRYDMDFKEEFHYGGLFFTKNNKKDQLNLEMFFRKVATHEGECLEFYFNDISEIRKKESKKSFKRFCNDYLPRIFERIKSPLKIIKKILKKNFNHFNFRSKRKIENEIDYENKEVLKNSRTINLKSIEEKEEKNIDQINIHKIVKDLYGFLTDKFKDILKDKKYISYDLDFVNSKTFFPFILEELIRFSYDLSNLLLKNKKIKIFIEYDSQIKQIIINNFENKIKELLMLLIHNSIKCLEEGYLKLKFYLLDKDTKIINIEIEDSRGRREIDYLENILFENKDFYNELILKQQNIAKTSSIYSEFEKSRGTDLGFGNKEMLFNYKNILDLSKHIGEGLIYKKISNEKCSFTFSIYLNYYEKEIKTDKILYVDKKQKTLEKIDDNEEIINFKQNVNPNQIELFKNSKQEDSNNLEDMIKKKNQVNMSRNMSKNDIDSFSFARIKSEKSLGFFNEFEFGKNQITEEVDLEEEEVDKTITFSPKNINENFDNLDSSVINSKTKDRKLFTFFNHKILHKLNLSQKLTFLEKYFRAIQNNFKIIFVMSNNNKKKKNIKKQLIDYFTMHSIMSKIKFKFKIISCEALIEALYSYYLDYLEKKIICHLILFEDTLFLESQSLLELFIQNLKQETKNHRDNNTDENSFKKSERIEKINKKITLSRNSILDNEELERIADNLLEYQM